MNKEALRKELEDCFKAGYSYCHAGIPDMDSYITTRIAALDDGDGVMGIDFAKWIEENCEVIREPDITLYRYNDSRHGEGFGNYILDDIYTTYKELVGVDDGQEGKGLGKAITEIEQRKRDAVNTAGFDDKLAAGEIYAYGEALAIIKKHLAALPVADGEGEKVGEFQQIFSYECSCGWKGEWDKLISKHGGPSCPKCGIVLSEGQPAQEDWSNQERDNEIRGF